MSIQLKKPYLATAFRAAVLLLLSATGMEILCRAPFIQHHLPLPSLGSGHKNFDLKVAALDRFHAVHPHINCIYLGSSLVNRSINPAIVDKTVETITGRPFISFNFALAALNTQDAIYAVELLQKRYKPDLIVMGISSFGVNKDFFDVETYDWISNPWLTYQLEHPSFKGWLIEHSAAFKYYLRWQTWLIYPELSARIHYHETEEMNNQGFARHTQIMNIPKKGHLKKLKQILKQEQLSTNTVSNLKALLQKVSSGSLLLLEMPACQEIYLTAPYLPEKLNNFNKVIDKVAAAYGTPYWHTTGFIHIPDDGWKDIFHMNNEGATLFSTWLGKRLATYESMHIQKHPVHPPVPPDRLPAGVDPDPAANAQ